MGSLQSELTAVFSADEQLTSDLASALRAGQQKTVKNGKVVETPAQNLAIAAKLGERAATVVGRDIKLRGSVFSSGSVGWRGNASRVPVEFEGEILDTTISILVVVNGSKGLGVARPKAE